MNKHRSVEALVVVLAVAVSALALSACGGDDSNSSDKPAPSANSGTFKGDPIKIGVNVPVGTSAYNFPQAEAGAQAAAEALNAEGGINGHEVVIDACNSQADPNQEVACANKSVDDGAVALVDSYPVANGAGYAEILAKAGLADVAPAGSSPTAYEGDNTFAIDFGPGFYAGCTSEAVMNAAEATSAASTSIDVPAADPYRTLVTDSAANAGTEYGGDVKYPLQNADASTIVNQVADMGDPGLVILTLGEQQVAPFITASAGLGKDWSYCASASISGTETMKSLGDMASEYYQSTGFAPLSIASSSPMMQRFIDEAEASGDDNADVNSVHTLRAWLGMQIIAEASKGIKGEITRDSMREAVQKTKFNSDDIMPVIDFSKSVSGGPYKKIYNPIVSIQKWDPGEQVWSLIEDGLVDAVKAGYGG